jgi:pyruvate,water dikinase
VKLLGFFKKGARGAPGEEEESAVKTFRHFTLLLRANQEALEWMADLEEKAAGRQSFDRQSLQSALNLLSQKVRDLTLSLKAMNPKSYGDLEEVYERIYRQIRESWDGKAGHLPTSVYTIPLNMISDEMREQVGGKAANLGEVVRLGIPVPEGFAVTNWAYGQFLSHNHLEQRILSRLKGLSLEDPECTPAAEEIQTWILEARIPEEMEKALKASAGELLGSENGSGGLALRSSAAVEDGIFTFAGQYATFLNISPQEITSRYKEIAASQFTAPALFYLQKMGLPITEIAMGVICQKLVPAKSSGILFTSHPDPDHGETVLVNGVWGLGKPAVEGTLSPDLFLAEKKTGEVVDQKVSSRTILFAPHPGGGLQEEPVPHALSSRPCLEPKHLKTLWEWALMLEGHFHHPQDVEWVLDQQGNLYLLQTRNLPSPINPEREETPEISPDRILIDGGSPASFGVGSGPVFAVHSQEDLRAFPPGAVLVSTHASPGWVAVMDKAAAIITDIGSATGHLAILAREFNVPALVDTQMATRVLKTGQEVTVDVLHRRVYAGRVEGLLPKRPPRVPSFFDEPLLKRLRETIKWIGPLHLTDPQSPHFQSASCRTFHDLTRFVHEKAMEEMFRLGERDPKRMFPIKTAIPLNLFAFDLGGGLAVEKAGAAVLPEDIVSIPFRAFWRGVTYPGVRWSGPVGIDTQGLFSVMAQSATRPPEDFLDRSLALISKNYLHFNSRLGYHFATLDSFCGLNLTDNYINFMFHGGAADPLRRGRRARFIGRVLEHLGFDMAVKGDLVKAQYRKFPCSLIEEKLDYLGRLMGCSRLLDMTMSEDHTVERYVHAFLSGEYSLGEKRP